MISLMAFQFLSIEEFEALTSTAKLAYLSDAMAELQRLDVPREVRGWDSLFTPKDEPRSRQADGDPITK